jgi:pimeloyl-ACP methyl ester carboxylesterase
MLYVPALRQLPIAYGLLAKTRIPDDISTKYVRPCATNADIRRDVEKFSRTASRNVTLEVAKELKNFQRPALILWTPEDRFFPISLAERLCKDLPDARLERIADAHVFVAEDQPERVAREIREFILKGATQIAQPSMN